MHKKPRATIDIFQVCFNKLVQDITPYIKQGESKKSKPTPHNYVARKHF